MLMKREKQVTSAAELFQGKKILLDAPSDVSELIRSARYITLASQIASEVTLRLFDANGLAELMQSTFPSLKLLSAGSPTPLPHDMELDLAQLPRLFASDSCLAPVAYLQPPPARVSKFSRVMSETNLLNIGLAFYGGEDASPIDSTTFANNITLHQRHNTHFFFIPADPNSQGATPPYSHFSDTSSMVRTYGELAALLASLDIIICSENDVAHLATALGKPVWLLLPLSAQQDRVSAWQEFPNVTIFSQPAAGDWGEVVRAIAVFRLLQPERPVFTPFVAEGMQGQPVAQPLPVVSIEETSQLTQVFDAETAVFSVISIETTTVCNLRCPYCPHSTDMAKPPAYMPDEMFYRIIDSLYAYMPGYCGSISPSIYGEPLLDKRIESFVRYAKKRFPQARIELFTNGDFLTPEKFHGLQDAGIDHFNISQHTPARSQALTDTLTVLQYESAADLPITFIKMLEQNKFNRGGLVDVEGYSPDICSRMQFCKAAHQNLSFDYKGDAILCCNDYLSKYTFGNIASLSVREIWESSKYRRARNMIMLGFVPFPICRSCLSH